MAINKRKVQSLLFHQESKSTLNETPACTRARTVMPGVGAARSRKDPAIRLAGRRLARPQWEISRQPR